MTPAPKQSLSFRPNTRLKFDASLVADQKMLSLGVDITRRDKRIEKLAEWKEACLESVDNPFILKK